MVLLGHLVLWISLLADYVATRWAIRHGAVEGNPFLNNNPSALEMAFLLLGHGVVVEALSISATHGGHPTMASIFCTINGVVHLIAAISNVRVALRQIATGR